MADLLTLAKRLNAIADNIETAPSRVAVLFVQALVEDLTARTPVDTSKAISNWLVSLDDPVLIDLDAYVEGLFGSTASASRNEAIAHAERILSSKEPGQSIFISNSAPYIRDLNEGSSSQAPAGFVEMSIALARAQLPAIIKKVIRNG